MQTLYDRTVAELMEQLIETGPEGMATAFTAMLNLAMRLERERHVGAQAYERSPERSWYANGYKTKKIDTPAGTLTIEVPKSRGGDAPFYPQALERGRRSSRAVMLAIAQMYIQGVSTRDVEKVMAEFGLESLSSAQVSRAAALMDEELEAWRARRLGAFPYLFLPLPVLGPATRRSASTVWSATPPSYRRSASMRTASAGCSESPLPSPRPKSTGEASSTAS